MAGPGPGTRFEPQPHLLLGTHRLRAPVLVPLHRGTAAGMLSPSGPNPIYGRHVAMMLPVVHPIIGHRRLRDTDSHRGDEMVGRTSGPKRLLDVSTVSRSLGGADG